MQSGPGKTPADRELRSVYLHEVWTVSITAGKRKTEFFAAWNNGGNYDVCVGVVLARMAVLTVFRGNELRRRADENRILIRKIPAPRGIIFDRNSKALTRNVPEGRTYPFGNNFPHLVGFVSEVSEEEIKNDPSLNPGDIIGKSGLEKQYDKALRGIDGAELIEVDANGNLLGF